MIITDVDNLSADVVHDVHLEGSAGAAAIPGAAVIVLTGEENVLAQRVEHPVLVGRLPASEYLQHLNLLLDQEVIHHSHVLQAGGAHITLLRIYSDGLAADHARGRPGIGHHV